MMAVVDTSFSQGSGCSKNYRSLSLSLSFPGLQVLEDQMQDQTQENGTGTVFNDQQIQAIKTRF